MIEDKEDLPVYEREQGVDPAYILRMEKRDAHLRSIRSGYPV